MTSLLILSQEPCISLPGGQAEAMGMATTGNTAVLWTGSSCSWAPPGCSGPWDSVASNDSPSEKGVAQRAQGTQPIAQSGQVTLHFSPPAHYHVTSQLHLSP